MTFQIPFAKASGAGNDFVLINNRSGWLRVDYAGLARALCARHTGIGADGLIVLEPSAVADFRMMYFNRDGSHGGMCGNGGRCIARFALMLGIAGPSMKFDALGYVYEADAVAERVRLRMKDPIDYRPSTPLQIGEDSLATSFLNTGAPHAVAFVDDLAALNVQKLGSAVRHHMAFAPEGTNANFVQVLDTSSIEIRTYERGVETETLACGTGSIASAIVSSLEKGVKFPVRVHVRSGEDLHVHATASAKGFTDVLLEGSAQILFGGLVLYDDQLGEVTAYSSDQLLRMIVP